MKVNKVITYVYVIGTKKINIKKQKKTLSQMRILSLFLLVTLDIAT